jgi:hypothetical protein
MLNIKTIQVRAFILLFVYLASNIPVSFFHTHKNDKIALEKATACEKKIYYGEVDGDCEHGTHVSKQIEKCSLCDTHFAKPYTTLEYGFNFPKKTFTNQYKIDFVKLISHNPITLSNKGPPATAWLLSC